MEPSRPHRFPNSSQSDRHLTQRIQAAKVRALESYTRLARLAGRVTDEIGETTSPHGIPVTDLADTDSMVIAVKNASGKSDRASTVDEDD